MLALPTGNDVDYDAERWISTPWDILRNASGLYTYTCHEKSGGGGGGEQRILAKL